MRIKTADTKCGCIGKMQIADENYRMNCCTVKCSDIGR